MEPVNWAVEVGPSERLKVTVEYGRLLEITKVAMGDRKNGEEVEEFHVYFTRINCNGEMVEVAILSSDTPEASNNVALYELEIVEFSHGWKNGSVHISGRYIQIMRQIDGFPYSGTSQGKQQKPSLTAKSTRSSSSSAPTLEECMEIVGRFPGFEEGTTGYKQARLLFRYNETDRVHFMIPKTRHAKLAYLKLLIEEELGPTPTVAEPSGPSFG